MSGIARRRRIAADPHPSLADAVAVTRFWMLVDTSGDCWLWQGDLDKNGYGVFFWRGKRFGAQQLALQFATGEMKLDGLDTCHACDIPRCCNPEHLRFDSRASNVRDMVSRGRDPKPSARLTPREVVLIRERRQAGAPQRRLAIEFGVSEAYVSEIVRGLVWKSVGGPLQVKNALYRRNI